MICLRCGFCCQHLAVVVVDDPKLGLREDNLLALNFGEDHRSCKHLLGNCAGEYSCAIHNEFWYEDTPCFQHTQVEQDNQPCRIGEHIMTLISHKNVEVQ